MFERRRDREPEFRRIAHRERIESEVLFARASSESKMDRQLDVPVRLQLRVRFFGQRGHGRSSR